MPILNLPEGRGELLVNGHWPIMHGIDIQAFCESLTCREYPCGYYNGERWYYYCDRCAHKAGWIW